MKPRPLLRFLFLWVVCLIPATVLAQTATVAAWNVKDDSLLLCESNCTL